MAKSKKTADEVIKEFYANRSSKKETVETAREKLNKKYGITGSYTSATTKSNNKPASTKTDKGKQNNSASPTKKTADEVIKEFYANRTAISSNSPFKTNTTKKYSEINIPKNTSSYSMTKAEYDMRRSSNPSMPEYGSYSYYKKREEELRPIMEKIANDFDRQNPTYKAWVENYEAGRMPADVNEHTREQVINLSKKFKYQNDIIAEYKEINAQLDKFDTKGIHIDEFGKIDTKSGAEEAKSAKERYRNILGAEALTTLEMAQGYSGQLPEEKQKGYEQREKLAHLAQIEADKEGAYNYYEKNKDKTYEDTIGGRFLGNYKVGRIGIKSNQAGYTSYNATSDDIEASEVYQALSDRIQTRNKETFKNNGATDEIIAIIGQYAPQGVDQAVIGTVGKVVGGLVGSKSAGRAIATATYMYEQTAGAKYVQLLQESDLSVEDAKKLASDEALSSAIVEFGLDFATSKLWSKVGNTSVVNNATSTVSNKLIKALSSIGISEKGAKTILNVAKNTGKLILNSMGEGSEEWWQEGISITADRYAAEGEKSSPFKLLLHSLWLPQYSSEDFSRMGEAFLGGAIIGFGQGGVEALTSYGINKTASKFADTRETNNTQGIVADAVINDEESLNALIEEGKANGTASAKIAEEVEQAKENGTLTKNQVKKLISANEKAIKTEESTPDPLEKTAREVVEERNRIDGLALLEARGNGNVTPQMLERLSQVNAEITNEEAKKATGFGDKGAELVAKAVNTEGATFYQTVAEVRPSYVAGFNNPDMDIKKVAHTFDSQAQQDAYTAGQQDAVMQNTQAEAKARNARVFGAESGVKNENSAQYSPRQMRMADTIGKDLGAQVSFEERLLANEETGYEANAYHQNGEIKISNNSENKFIEDIMEESLHRMSEIDTEAVRVLKRATYEFITEIERSKGTEGITFDEEKALYDNAGQSINTRGIMEEVSVGTLSRELFKDEKQWLKWRERLDTDSKLRQAWYKLMDIVSEIIAKIERLLEEKSFSKETRAKVNKEMAELKRLKGLYTDAYVATRDAVAEKTNNQNTETRTEAAQSPVASESKSVNKETPSKPKNKPQTKSKAVKVGETYTANATGKTYTITERSDTHTTYTVTDKNGKTTTRKITNTAADINFNRAGEEGFTKVKGSTGIKVGDVFTAKGTTYKIVSRDAMNTRIEISSKEGTQTMLVSNEVADNNFINMSKEGITKWIDEDMHIDNRTWEDVGDRKVKAFQFLFPEMKEYYTPLAQELLGDLDNTIEGERIKIGSYDMNNEEWVGVSRYTSEAIATIKDSTNATYDDIRNALHRLINDEGEENIALAKRIELVFDDMLTNGYTTFDGAEIEANEEYITKKEALIGKTYEKYVPSEDEELPYFSLKNKNLTINSRIPFTVLNNYINVAKGDKSALGKLVSKVSNLKRGTYKNDATGYKADINADTIRKAIHPTHNKFNPFTEEHIRNLNAMLKLPELFKKAVYVDTKPPQKSKNKNKAIKGFHHFVAPLFMDNGEYRAIIRAREKVNSNILYVLSVEVLPTQKRHTLSAAQQKNAGGSQWLSVPSNISIPELVNGVKIKNYDTNTNTTYTSADIQFSLKQKAPTFYSQMGKTIDGIKQDKIGANSVVSYLTGRGVKAEEIKWSGIETFLEGKKSVTKAELQEFVAGSMLDIGVKTIEDDIAISYTQDELEELDRDGKLLDKAWAEANDIWNEAYGTDIPADIMGNDDAPSAMVRYVIDQHGGIRNFEGISHLSDAERKIYDDYSENSITRKIKDLEEHQAYIAERAKARRDNTKQTKYHKYTLDGGSGNYRELLFKMPNSEYTNDAMSYHWGEGGILAHARVQDFDVNGQKMLFIEEIQSDWHNEGQKKGYVTDNKKLKEQLENLKKKNNAERNRLSEALANHFKGKAPIPTVEATNFINSMNDDLGFQNFLIKKYDIPTELVDRAKAYHKSKTEEMEIWQQSISAKRGVEDAPFRNNYHEYVLKNLLRMAAEDGYDSIGWTTADIQSDRWSDKYAEGYRIEYDQDIPKFLNKYGKKWGAKVGKTEIGKVDGGWYEVEGTEVWSMPITDSMKDSVLYEGQPMFSLKAKDQEYLELAKDPKKNKAKLNKMVKEAAKEAGYTGTYYHGSKSDFTVFKKEFAGKSNSNASIGFWFTETEKGAKNWINNIWWGDNEKGKVYKTYLRLNNPKVYETLDTKAQRDELSKGYESIDKEMTLYDDIYYFEDGRRYHTERYDYDKSKRRRSGIAEWDAFKAIVKKYDADTIDYYLSKVAENEREIVKKDAERYVELSQERKALEKQMTELRYFDAYELFRTDMYKQIGLGAEDANIGGTGKYVENEAEMLKKYVDMLKQEGYDGIIIKGTAYDTDTFGENNNQYLVLDSNQVKSAEPVTYDDNGKVIPLSERFNAKNDDMRYSLKDIKKKYADKTDHLYIYEKKNTISIDNMVVKKGYRNQGVGTAILNDVINYADQVQKTITLTPTSEFGTKERLKKWYKANGFVENKGRNTDFTISDTMYRFPSAKSFSLKGGISPMELLNTIGDAQKGKKGAAEKLAKYVESGMIRTKTYDELVEKYGVIPSGERPHREVQVPRKTGKNKKVSQTVRTILEAKATPDEAVPTIEKMVEDGIFSYDVYTDKAAIEDGENYIKTHGWEQSLVDWFDAVNSGEVSKEITTTGWILYNHAANSGDAKTAIMILDAMVRHQRSAAQALQATRILKKLSPEAQLYGVQKSVEAYQKELKQRYGDKAPDLEINEELAEKFLNAETEEERLDAEIELYKDIGRQMPSDWLDRWNAWRYLAMLGNLRTHIRNIVGNAGFAPIIGVKNLTATVIESMVAPVVRLSGREMLRGKSIVWGSKADRALLKAAWKDYENVADIVSNGGKYNDSAMGNKYIEDERKILNNWKPKWKFLKPVAKVSNAVATPLELARKGNSKALEAEDMWFSKPHYAYALAQYCKANNITADQISRGKAIAPAREYAIREAQKATYKDTNGFSQLVSGLGRNKSITNHWTEKVLRTAIEGILPFRKTPANILVRGVEYSPLGLLKGLSYDLYQVSKGKMTASEAIDNISAGLTGTGLLALGVLLAAQGLIRGHGEDDKDEKEFKEMMGHQSYALELPNGQSITLDWLAPEALPLFVGVNLWETSTGSEEEVNLSAILQAVSLISEPMLKMSCLQGLNDLFEGIGYASSNDTSGLVSALSSAVTSYLMQGIPTLSGQAERTGEEERMTTYTEKNAFLTGDMQYTLGKASAKIPFWDYNQIPYIDAWGRREASGTALKRGLNNFLNPAYTSTIDTSYMEEELLRLYDETGESGVFPSRADKYFTVDGERKDLTADEYVRYATLKGEKSYKAVTDLVNSSAYEKLSDEEKAKAIKEAYEYANQKAKQTISNYEPEAWVGKADDFSNVGNYLSFRAEVSSTKKQNGEELSKEQIADIALDMAQNDAEVWKMYLSTRPNGGSESDLYAYDMGIDGETYMYFLESLNEVDTPSKSGKYGTYTQDEAKKAVNRISGLSKQEKSILWQSVNTGWKKNPFR